MMAISYNALLFSVMILQIFCFATTAQPVSRSIRLQLEEGGNDPASVNRISERWKSLKRDLADLTEMQTDALRGTQQALVSGGPVLHALLSLSAGNNRVLEGISLKRRINWKIVAGHAPLMDLASSRTLDQLLEWNALSVEEGELSTPPDYLEVLLSLVQTAVQAGSALPTETSYSILTSDAVLSQKARAAATRVSEYLFHLLEFACPKELRRGPEPLVAASSLLTSYGRFPDCIEALLVKADEALRTCSGPALNATISQTECYSQTTAQAVSQSSLPLTEATSDPLTSQWRQAFRQSHVGCFVPMLTYKPHGCTPLPGSIVTAQRNLESGELFLESSPLPHPYAAEIERLDWLDPKSPEGSLRLFQPSPPRLYQDFERTPLVWVTTEEELDQLLQEISSETEVAIDLEHHSKYSYRGMTCLIQLSTRTKDFLIDPLPLRSVLVKLNTITADPKILKIFHGADSDIIWLQRDFSVYVVNMFDTGQAARVLEIPGGASLANLLQVSTDKSFQLADWRRRPLSPDMVQYARTDTHYLLYVFDKVRNALLETKSPERLQAVLNRSRALCLKCYEETPKDFEAAAAQIISQHTMGLTPAQTRLLIALLQWRDTLALARDEAPTTILATHYLVKLAEKAPKNWLEVTSVSTRLPRLIQEKAADILDLVKNCERTLGEKPPASIIVPEQPSCLPRKNDSLKFSTVEDSIFLEQNQSDMGDLRPLTELNAQHRDEPEDKDVAQSTLSIPLVSKRKVHCPELAKLTRKPEIFCSVKRVSRGEQKYLLADGFQVVLSASDEAVQRPPVVTKLSSTANKKVLARAISKVASQYFIVPPLPPMNDVQQQKKRPLQQTLETSAPAPNAGDAKTEPIKSFSVVHEVLVDKTGAKRRKRRGRPKLEALINDS